MSSSNTSKPLSIEDYIALNNLTFEWAESYDLKDWVRLKACLAPSIRLDFRALHGELHEAITPEGYVAIHSDPKVIGDPRMKTQHLFGRAHWSGIEGDGTVRATHQLRVAHQRYADETLQEVINKGHGYGRVEQTYKKFGDTWKITGSAPNVGWFEYDLFGTLDPDLMKEVL